MLISLKNKCKILTNFTKKTNIVFYVFVYKVKKSATDSQI